MRANIQRQKAWNLMRSLREFSSSELQKQGINMNGWTKYSRLLVDKGYIEAIGWKKGNKYFELIKNTGPGAPIVLQGELYDQNLAGPILEARTRLWRCLRSLTEFTKEEVIMLSEVNRLLFHKYSSDLKAAGYLKPIGKGSKHGVMLYRLIRNTGPLAPIRVEEGVLWDANKQVVYPEDAGVQI